MVSVAYSEAAVEVLDILKHTRKEDVEKIPKEFIKFLKENASKTYNINLDHTKKIAEMNLKPKTQAILGVLFLKYLGNQEEKEAFRKRIEKNEENYQKEIQEKYNIENVFKKRQAVIKEKTIEEKVELPVVIQKGSFIQKIINIIKGIFKK